ncbi:HAMP domain-containing sensor histidine kinase [Thomasclavelia cocleata]|uniref:histidine kinase n=1 Tax=Thomasclavelia cocleata TaxID=69824 RepID=A0A829ZD76_9FIRM|nr:HAMP domain-containing sensor histidine kinase [Thomasclavelia cocleata]GFI41937.1 sensor histidine kinase CssS [Thomasclavelia cocleata]
MLKKFSLQRQLIIIFSLIALVVLVILVPLINKNLTNLIDNQMFQTLETAQRGYVDYGYSPIEKSTDKQIYHMKYDAENNVLIPSANITYSDAEKLSYVFRNNLFEMIENDKEKIQKKGNLSGATVYYQITKKDDNTYIVSLVYSDYSANLISAIKQQIINILYVSFTIIGVVIFLWVSNLIKPLKAIRNYIEDIRNDKKSELKIDRSDEIGIVSNELVVMKEEIDRQNKTKEEMIHNISHDLKTPIALIKSYSQSVKDDIYPYGDKDASMDVIIENADRLDGKVKSLLYLNRLDFLSSENVNNEVDMKTLIEHITLQLQGMHPEIAIETDLAFVSFKGDEECWRICVENIIENAYRYVNSKIRIILKQNYLELYNDGESLDNENIEALFKPYEKGTKGQFGLGLSIVYKTCTMYGYNVTAVNRDIGVSFIIEKNING